MTQRLVSVGDDFTLPAAVKAADANLPARLQDTALNATYASKAEVRITVAAADSPARAKARADYVCTGTGDLAVIQTALDALPDDNAVSGEVLLLAGNYQDATGDTVSIGSPSLATLNPRKILHFQRGGRLNVSNRTGRKAVIKVESPDCQIVNPNISNNTAFGNSTGIAAGGGDIATFGGRWDRAVNRGTIWSPIISNCETAIEFPSIDGGPGVGGSAGDWNVYGGYLFQNKTALRAAGYVNTVHGTTVANNNVNVWVEGRRSEAQLRTYALTLVGWNEHAFRVDGGYGSTFHDTWMEHTSATGSTSTEALRFGTATTRANLTHFTGTTTVQLVNEQYVARYVNALGTTIDDLVISTSGAVPSVAIARNELASTGKRNRIVRTTFGPNTIPSHVPLSIDAAAWGDVFMDRVPGAVGDVPFSTRINSSTRGSSSPAVRKAADTSKTSDATLAVDTDMTIALAPATNYALTGMIMFDANQTADFKMQFNLSAANGTLQWTGTGPASSHTSAIGISSVTSQVGNSGFVQAWGGAAAGTPVAVPITGIIKTVDLSTLTMSWAQNTADATPTILKNGSWLRLEQIP